MDRDRPRAVAIATALIALMGVAAIYLGSVSYRSDQLLPEQTTPWLVIGGVAALIAAAMVWWATAAARLAGMAVALFALLPGLYGLGGLGAVSQQFQGCQSIMTASLIYTSYPEGYCETVSWPYQFGVGIGLVSVGLAGLFVVFALAGNGEYFRRANRGKWRRRPDSNR